MDFGKVLVNREEVVKEALESIKENVKLQDRKDWDRNVQGAGIMPQGSKRKKELERRKILTEPITTICSSAGDKE